MNTSSVLRSSDAQIGARVCFLARSFALKRPPSECRWRNEPDGKGDKLNYGRAEGAWDPTRGNVAFGTPVTAVGPYAVTGASNIRSRTDNAMLVSSPIPCQIGDADLRFR